MPSSSSGVGDDLGSSSYLSIQELEKTAAVQVTRDRLGIVQDSLEVNFTQLGGNIWKYEASANRPTLAPLQSLRISQSDDTDTNDSTKAIFDQLLEQIPTETKARYLKDASLPAEERNPSYTALGNALTTIAQLLNWMGTTDIDKLNPAPTLDQNSFVAQGQSLVDSMKNYLSDIGSNDPDYDRLTHVITEAEANLSGMHKVNENISRLQTKTS